MSKKMKVKHLYTTLQGNVGGANPNSLRAHFTCEKLHEGDGKFQKWDNLKYPNQ